jgi:hypothetical protein
MGDAVRRAEMRGKRYGDEAPHCVCRPMSGRGRWPRRGSIRRVRCDGVVSDGHVTDQAGNEDADALLDKFMPTYDVAERHHVRVAAPAEVTLKAATEMDLQRSAIVRGILKAREWIMRGHPTSDREVRAFLPQMRAIGWGVLAEIPGREIVMGAVTQPWMADVVFRPLPPKSLRPFTNLTT